MKKIFFIILCFSLKTFAQLMPLNLTSISTWSIPLIKGKPVKMYTLTESNNYLVVDVYSDEFTNTRSVINPETSFVLDEKEVEILKSLLPQFIKADDFDMLKLQGLDTTGKIVDQNSFNWTFKIIFNGNPGKVYVGAEYSTAAKQALQLILNTADDKKHKTLKEVLKK